jgi:hypothetical protein
MARPPRCRSRLSLVVVGLVVTCALVDARGAAPGRSSWASPHLPVQRSATLLFDLPVPGGLTNLFAVAHIAPAPRPVALLALIRLLHVRAGALLFRKSIPAAETEVERLAKAIDARLQSAASLPSPDTVPLPLSPDVWITVVFKKTVTRDGLLRAILHDRRASLLYYGLLSVDDATLEYFDARPGLIEAIYEQGVGVFASCARSIRIKDDVVSLPGGDAARLSWEAVVGEAAANADKFILALLAGDAGRRAYFLDAVAHLDAPAQAFALGAARPPVGREKQMGSLFAAVAAFDRSWDVNVWPFVRRPVDAATILMQVRVLPDGRMAPPAGQPFWSAALDGNADGCGKSAVRDGGSEMDAAWLVTRILRENPDTRQAMLNAILFAQRRFSMARGAEVQVACSVVARFSRFTGLIAVFERMGFSDPGDYLRALDFAQGLGAEADRRTAVLSFAQMQGILVVLERVVATSPAQRSTAQELARSLCGLPVPAVAVRKVQRAATQATAPLVPGRFGEWMKTVLFPRLCRPQESPDMCLEEVAAGLRAATRPQPVIEWEGQRYRVDPASAFSLRVSRIRERQRPMKVEWAMNVVDIGVAVRDEPFNEASAARQANGLQRLAERIDPSARTLAGGSLGTMRTALENAAGKLAAARRKPPTAAADILEAADGLLADAMTSFAYAMAIGDTDSSYLLADDPARRHEFLVAGSPSGDLKSAWQLAHEAFVPAAGWTVQGSLLGLNRACALSWQRRISLEPITVPPTLDEHEPRGFAESAAALNPFELTDAGRSGIVAAIGRGRTAIGTLLRDPAAFTDRVTAVGVSEWRVRGALWLANRDPGAVAGLFSLVELLWLGNPDIPAEQIDAWGVPTSAIDGSLSVRMPRGRAWEDIGGGRGPGLLFSHVADLQLRVAIWLDEAKLPAALTPGLLSFATWDLVTTAQPVDADDYLAVVRAAQAVSGDRLVDYVSSLTADGTLVPVGKGGKPLGGGAGQP